MTGGAAVGTTVLDVLERLDSDFAPVADAVENGEFALWVGSGISGRAPSLGVLVALAIEFLRENAVDPSKEAMFRPALDEAVEAAQVTQDEVKPHLGSPFASWPKALHDKIVTTLWNKYSVLLDIRIEGEDDDLILWTGIDIRQVFENPKPPASEHLCIAILILEGALTQIASANWDGFIEAAVERLGPGLTGNLQVIVDPDHLRDGAAKAQLLKFHGCIVHATDAPDDYRRFLTGSTSQIMDWTVADLFKPMVERITAIATDRKALMVGLSLQDVNLQQVFTRARNINPWPWPAAPAAQGHVFCEERGLSERQVAMLKSVYKTNYNPHVGAIKAGSLLQAWPSAVLPALALRLITDKLGRLLEHRLAGTPLAPEAKELSIHLSAMRDAIAAGAPNSDLTDFVNAAIARWTRLVSLHRDGGLPGNPDAYQAISHSPVSTVANDGNVVAAGFGDLALTLGLLQYGVDSGRWTLSATSSGPISDGAVVAKGSYIDAKARPLFIVRGVGQALKLQKAGAFNDNSIVIHADSAWTTMFDKDEADLGSSGRGSAGKPPGRTGRVRAQHVSLEQMVEGAGDLRTLKDLFLSGITV
jgi:hypothetical protein